MVSLQQQSGKQSDRSDNVRYFDSKFFRRLYASYSILILLFVLMYSGWYVISLREQYSEEMESYCTQQAVAYGTTMDRQLMAAQSSCAAVNFSESCRSVFQDSLVERQVVDSMQLYRVLNELSRIRGSSVNMNIYSLFLCFQNDTKAYMPGAVMDFTGTPRMLENAPKLAVSTISEMLGVTNHSQILFNKQYLIYADDYLIFNKGTPKGITLILFELSGLQTLAEQLTEVPHAATVYCDGEEVLCFGEAQGRRFSAVSLLSNRITYGLYVPESVFTAYSLGDTLMPVVLIILLGGAFMLATYFLSRHFYRPIDSISQMIEHGQDSGNELTDIMAGIRSLIGERNGYRERLITISPYAEQGIVHSLISGGAQEGRLSTLTDNDFLELRRECYAVALVNIVRRADLETSAPALTDIHSLIHGLCHELSSAELSAVCCARDSQNMYVVANTDDASNIEPFFYTLHKRIRERANDPGLAVTIGVSSTQNDLGDLQLACDAAATVLRQMVTGGRNSVYFDDTVRVDEPPAYFFPADAIKHITRSLHEGDLDALYATLDEIEQKNLQDAELPVSQVEQLLNELYYTIRTALRCAYERTGVHVQLEHPRDTMTFDEIIAYYKTVFETAVVNLSGQPPEKNDIDEAVCEYIQASYCDPDLSLNAVADRFGVSTKVVGNICKRHFGATFLQYVRERQIERAKELLKNTSLSLDEISHECGFVNTLTFRRNFKTVTHVNPSDFRR